MNSIKTFLKKSTPYALLLLGGILLACLLMEITVRLFFPQPERFYVADPYIKTIHKANTTIVRKGPEFISARMTTNAQGFIGDDDFIKVKPAGTIRIAALGDSFTEGYVIDYTKVYPALLEKKLNSSTEEKKYQVYNFGIASTGTAHQLLTYEHYIRTYKPDILVWEFFVGNDYADNLLFEPDTVSPEETHSGFFWKTRYILSTYFEAPRFILHRLQTLDNVKNVLTRLSLVSPNLNHYDDARDYPFLFDIYNTATSSAFAHEFTRTCTLAKSLSKEAEKDGVAFIALVVPTQEEVFPSDWEKLLTQNPSMKNVPLDVNQPLTRVLKCLENAHVQTLNMKDVFQSALVANGKRMYFVNDNHANQYGQELLADTLAHTILSLKK